MKEKVNTKTKVALTPPFRGGWEGRSILDKIIADKRIEVASRKAVTSIADLEKNTCFRADLFVAETKFTNFRFGNYLGI